MQNRAQFLHKEGFINTGAIENIITFVTPLAQTECQWEADFTHQQNQNLQY